MRVGGGGGQGGGEPSAAPEVDVSARRLPARSRKGHGAARHSHHGVFVTWTTMHSSCGAAPGLAGSSGLNTKKKAAGLKQ